MYYILMFFVVPFVTTAENRNILVYDNSLNEKLIEIQQKLVTQAQVYAIKQKFAKTSTNYEQKGVRRAKPPDAPENFLKFLIFP